MKILLSWLREFAPFGDDVDALAADLTRLGMEVSDVEPVGQPVPGVVVARVLETRRHPQAERVQEVFVDAGDGERRHVWCGAFNMQAGDLVPLATLGTTMPDGRMIEPRKILGSRSEGMLCSARELGLGDDAAVIHILPPGLPLGADVFEALHIEPDVVFDLDVTRNRPDAYGHLGVVRDLAGKLGLPVRTPGRELTTSGPPRSAQVEILDPDLCGRFVSLVLSGVQVGPSADWMQTRLARAGMRPINNVVDVSNYVMLELNEPNHAYDLATLGGDGFRIRRARGGETIVTLDDVERVLTTGDLLICDAMDRPIGIAGIMGGADTEIGPATTEVALEMAWFDPVAIAATAARLGVRSEASARFERGRDPYGIDRAVARFVELLQETCPGLVVHDGVVDARGQLPPRERSTPVRVAAVNRLLGTALDVHDLRRLLDPICFTVTPGSGSESVDVALPSWRPDATGEVDVIEEVARHHGYERLGKTVPKSTIHGHLSDVQIRRRLVRDVLAGLGISEAMPNPFLAPGDLERAGLHGRFLEVANPLVAEERVLRTSLRPGLLRTVAYNESHRNQRVSLYEIGHVYPPGDGPLPAEREDVTIVLAGRDAPSAVEAWHELVAALGLAGRVDLRAVADAPGLHSTRTATVSLDGVPVGHVGEIDPGVLQAFAVEERVGVLDVSLTALITTEPEIPLLRPVSRFPSSDIDLAFVVDDAIPASDVTTALRGAAGDLLADLALFDVFRGEALGAGRRSLAYRLRLQAVDHTLTDAEVGEIRERIVAAVAAAGATLRG
jgi:phenylalanyl-tRNA synthetase beta chain